MDFTEQLKTLDERQQRATVQIKEMVRLTTLAMRAARHGLESLSGKERSDLFCFVGFDISALIGLNEGGP